MKLSVATPVGACFAAAALLFSIPVYPATDSLIASMETYFSDLKEDFNQRAASSIIKTPSGAQLSAYFAKILKKKPSLASLMKVNAKGTVLCERIRDEKYAVTKHSVAKRQWFLKTAKSLKKYDCCVHEKNGGVYLYWSVPLLREGAGSRRFNGAVLAVVDLKDCFQAITKAGVRPFLVLLNNKVFYEHAWKSKMIFVEDRLSVPGVETITVRYQKSNVSIVPQTETPQKSDPDSLAAPQAVSAAKIAGDTSSAGLQGASVSAAKKNMPIIVSLIILIVIVAVLLIIQIADRINRRRTTRSGDKPDRS
jgi:hypothetical protein